MKQKLTDRELSAFSGQLALILHSGISLLEGISILKEDTPEKDGGSILAQVYETLDETGDFTLALKDSGFFPDYFLKMTEIGEKSGTLEEVMESLSRYYANQDALLHNIRDALTYPLVLLGMLTAVLAVLITQVMPVFADVFDQLGIAMSGMAQTVFRMGGLLQKIAAVLLILVIAAAAFALYATRSSKGKEFLLEIFRRIPLSRRVLMQIARSRFSHALALSLHSGLDMNESFSLAAELTDRQLLNDNLTKAGALLEQGNDFGETLRESGIFSGLDARLVSIGFRTGSAETALMQISENSQQEAEETIQQAVGAIEPTLTAFLSILTGIILVSVMLPLLGVMANIG